MGKSRGNYPKSYTENRKVNQLEAPNNSNAEKPIEAVVKEPIDIKLFKKQRNILYVIQAITTSIALFALYISWITYKVDNEEACFIRARLDTSNYQSGIVTTINYDGNYSDTTWKFGTKCIVDIVNTSKNPISIIKFNKLEDNELSMKPDMANWEKILRRSHFYKKELDTIIKIDPGSTYRYTYDFLITPDHQASSKAFNFLLRTVKLKQPENSDTYSLDLNIRELFSYYYKNNIDLLGNKMDVSFDQEGQIVKTICKGNKNKNIHIVFKTAKGNYFSSTVSWYQDSSL